MKKLIVGSRESSLAVMQTELVMREIKKHNPTIELELKTFKTTGDKILNKSLDKIGGKGLFVKELDQALMDGTIDIAVHSLKDVPMEVNEELPIVAVIKRGDPRDVLCLPQSAGVNSEQNPDIDMNLNGKVIGSSSLRRALQLKKLYKDADVESVRGNIQTRLRKLDEGQFDAIMLAAAGLKRAGLDDCISRVFSVDEILPAAGQGTLVIQAGKNFDRSILKSVNDDDTMAAAMAERAFVKRLNGGCSSPVAAYAEIKDEKLHLTGLYYNECTKEIFKDSLTGNIDNAEKTGIELADSMKKRYGKSGKVWLVGAGPSDVSLLTVKAKRLISEAEVVVYDQLVDISILQLIPDGAESFDAGKHAGNHTMKQEDINELLVKKALEGKSVVRLKGGDPFVFGRGGEEIEALIKENIEYEEVPGIPSPVAVCAYAGIPVTHRDYAPSFHVVTAHRKRGNSDGIDYKGLAALGDVTLIFLMGIGKLKNICQGLIEAGMSADTPAAVIQNGTRYNQKKVISDLGNLYQKAVKADIGTPGIIVVGRVCQLADTFEWVSKNPLAGKRVIVTRPKEKSSTLGAVLKDKGAQVLEIPVTRIEPVNSKAVLNVLTKDISGYDWIVFTSAAGVRLFFSQLMKSGNDIRSIAAAKFAVVGDATAKELAGFGINADYEPQKHYGNELANGLVKQINKDEKVIIVTPQNKESSCAKALQEYSRKYGFTCDSLPLYRTEICKPGFFDWNEDDIVTFASSSAVEGFAQNLNKADMRKVNAVCIGKLTYKTATGYGMKAVMSDDTSIDSLAQKVIEVVQ